MYILSVPTPGKPLNCGTALAVDNFFVKDLVSRVRPSQPGSLVQKYVLHLVRPLVSESLYLTVELTLPKIIIGPPSKLLLV